MNKGRRHRRARQGCQVGSRRFGRCRRRRQVGHRRRQQRLRQHEQGCQAGRRDRQKPAWPPTNATVRPVSTTAKTAARRLPKLPPAPSDERPRMPGLFASAAASAGRGLQQNARCKAASVVADVCGSGRPRSACLPAPALARGLPVPTSSILRARRGSRANDAARRMRWTRRTRTRSQLAPARDDANRLGQVPDHASHHQRRLPAAAAVVAAGHPPQVASAAARRKAGGDLVLAARGSLPTRRPSRCLSRPCGLRETGRATRSVPLVFRPRPRPRRRHAQPRRDSDAGTAGASRLRSRPPPARSHRWP